MKGIVHLLDRRSAEHGRTLIEICAYASFVLLFTQTYAKKLSQFYDNVDNNNNIIIHFLYI